MEKRGTPQRILVLDAQPVWLRAVESILNNAGFATTLTTSPKEALALQRSNTFALAIVGIDVEGFDWERFVEAIRADAPTCRLIVVSQGDPISTARRALELGADAYVERRVQPPDLVFAARQVISPDVYHVTPAPGADVEADPGTVTVASLTSRERQILALLADGYSNAAIATALGITEPTVKGHLRRLYRKIGVGNRAAAASWMSGSGRSAPS
jgi:two-component system nitrate/nitrite response regulator NarL